MDMDSLPRFIVILLALVVLMIIFAKVMNVDVLENISSMIITLSKNIFSSLAF
jgi:hypothetical protein